MKTVLSLIRNNKKKSILITILFFLITFIVLHSTPNLSIRTCLFFDGHFLSAFTSKINTNTFQYNLDKNILDENEMIYKLDNSNITFRDTKNPIYNFKVKEKYNLYFATYYGEL